MMEEMAMGTDGYARAKAAHLDGRVAEHGLQMKDLRQRLERLEEQVMHPNPLEGFEESKGRELVERNKFLESRVKFLENHIRQVSHLIGRIESTEQQAREVTLAAVEEKRLFAPRAGS